ncbi:ABC transporter ATP-binding protein [Paenibacillus sp. J5C_2022]|uniref:ABC transporter ATP-binding protein n=1 Tax=Paenibacillus sp. J5C2022 TaxID=2977129 RepID=UPI0021CE6940|nr:ABC transporter ATP-binding protein [Paenibacillus sp. J5C2022]MCU6708916.1 ABC transporter ATP-binding protein [Paenibacillus sp. J5C2022]
MLDVLDISKSFLQGKKERKRVLEQLSLHVDEGEFVSVVGPSGSGKSTLFGVIGGLEEPDGGDIWIDGRRTTGERGHVAYMPQQASLLPWRTVEANIELSLTIAGMEKREALSLARQWLARIGLADYAAAYPHMLSGGMSQRVSFLRALLSPQRLMLLDEPFGALDALTRMQMQHWLLSIWEENRRSVLLVTHSIEEALYLSDRIIVLSAAPAVVLDEIAVPFPRPRSETLWKEPQFNELKGRIYDQLQGVKGADGHG